MSYAIDYSSSSKFSVFYDGKDIKDYDGNAVSVFSDEESLSIQAKGLVNVNDLDKKILYQGKTAGVYSEYDYYTANFDVENGEASVSNGKHKIDIKDGLAVNNDNLEYSGKEASPFSVSYSKDGNSKESLLVNYLEKEGKIQTEAVYFKDGKESIVDLGNLVDQEVRYAERTKLPTRADIDNAIFNLDKNDPQYEKKLADLYATRGLMSEQETSNYKVGQEVFEVSEGHMRSLGKIAKINDDGTFVLEGGYYYNVQDIGAVSGESMTLTKGQLDKLKVSKLGLGQEIGETKIKDIEYDSTTKQIKYLFENGQESLEKQTILDYFSDDYKTAISYYQEAQKNPQLAGEASLSLASVYQQMGDTSSAKKEYMALLRDSNSDEQTKSLAYKGLISNYFQEQNPRMALSTTFEASQENPNDANLAELNKQLTKSYLETISSAINTKDAQVLVMWKEKVGFGEKWYNVGLDQPIVSWFKEDINFATGFSRDQLSEQQKGILVMKNLLDRGYSLKDVQSMNANQIRDIFKIQSAEAVDMTNAIKIAFQNSDVQNLANGAKYTFDFETGTGYVDKEFLEKGLAEKILSGVNTKNVAIYLATEGIGYGVGALRSAELAGSTGAGLTASTGFWTKQRYVANLFQEGTTPYYVTKTLTSDVFIELPANLKQLSSHLETQSLIKGLASESGASLGTTTLANTKITSLDFDDVSSVNRFLNNNVLGSTDEGIRILSKDAKAGQYLLEMNGQQFLTRVAGQEMSGTLQSQLLLAPARDRYLLTGTTALSNEINSKSFLEKTTQGVSTSGEIMTVKYNGADLALVIQGDKPVFYGLPRHQFSSGEIQFLENNGLKMMTFSDGRKIVYNPEKVANVLASDSAFYGAKGTTQEEILSTIFDKEKAMNGGELLGYGSRTMGGETGGLSIGAGGENYAYGFTGDNPAKMEMILRKNAQTLADISNEPVWVEINKKVIDIIMPTKEPLLLTEGIYASGRYLLNARNIESSAPGYIWPENSQYIAMEGGQKVIKIKELERVSYRPEYGTFDLIIREGESVPMTRYMTLPKEEAQRLVASRDPSLLYSPALKKNGGDWQEAVLKAKTEVASYSEDLRFQKGRDMVKEMSFYVGGSADAPGELGVATSLNNYGIVGVTLDEDEVMVLIRLEVPSEKIVLPGYSFTPYNDFFNIKFNRKGADVQGYGFFQDVDEGEVVFMGKIPDEYVKDITIHDRGLEIEEVQSGIGAWH